MFKITHSITFLLLFLFILPIQAQDLPVSSIKKKIEFYKNNYRGPYKKIEWFCEDGTLREARDPCPDSIGGGISACKLSR